MSQFGMQMPGGQMQRGPSLNVYTGLLALAALALIAASAYVYVQAAKVGKDGSPFGLQQVNDIKFAGGK
jgi:hypothetical protein